MKYAGRASQLLTISFVGDVGLICRNGVLAYVVLSFCRVSSVLGNELVVRVFPFTGPRVLEEAKPVCSV